MNEVPTSGEIEEAKKHPNGWIYRIVKEFEDSEVVPPEAIVGAWQVDESGNIVGVFQSNPNFTPPK